MSILSSWFHDYIGFVLVGSSKEPYWFLHSVLRWQSSKESPDIVVKNHRAPQPCAVPQHVSLTSSWSCRSVTHPPPRSCQHTKGWGECARGCDKYRFTRWRGLGFLPRTADARLKWTYEETDQKEMSTQFFFHDLDGYKKTKKVH